MDACSTHRTLLVLVAILVGIIASLIAGILAAAGGAHLAGAMLGAGATFVAVVPLVLVIEKELGLFPSHGATGPTN